MKNILGIYGAPRGHWVGDGFPVRSLFAYDRLGADHLSPFLLLDHAGPYDFSPGSRPRGVGAHPHRGFETVTYMIEGHMLHEDHMGNRGDLKNGGVQWMTAGRGIVHSEMPQQEAGQMRGFQLWLNLPAAEKMKPAGYRDIQPEEIPDVHLDGARLKLIAGNIEVDGTIVSGAVTGGSTAPLYVDIHMEPNKAITVPVSDQLNAMLYLYDGDATLQHKADHEPLKLSAATILGDGNQVRIEAGDQGARLLLIAGKPINEPVVQYGPFVMNTREEIEQTLRDYRDGHLTA